MAIEPPAGAFAGKRWSISAEPDQMVMIAVGDDLVWRPLTQEDLHEIWKLRVFVPEGFEIIIDPVTEPSR